MRQVLVTNSQAKQMHFQQTQMGTGWGEWTLCEVVGPTWGLDQGGGSLGQATASNRVGEGWGCSWIGPFTLLLCQGPEGERYKTGQWVTGLAGPGQKNSPHRLV